MSGRSGGVSEGEGSADDEEGHGARAAALVLPSFVETLWAMPDGFYQDIEIHYPEIWKMWMDFKYEEFDYMMELLKAGVAAGAFREVNLTILRMILITSTHNLNDADFLREQNMTGTDVMNVLEDIILHGIEK